MEVQQNKLRQITKQAAASKKITNTHEKAASNGNAEQASDLSNNVKLLRELETGSPFVKMAWEDDQNGYQGKSSVNREEHPTTSEVPTKQEVTVEIHSYHKDKDHPQKATINCVEEKSFKEKKTQGQSFSPLSLENQE